MTKQEAYDYLRKARYARERKATEDALRPRMVTRATAAMPMDLALARLERRRELEPTAADVREAAERIREAIRTGTYMDDCFVKDVTAGAIVPGHDD